MQMIWLRRIPVKWAKNLYGREWNWIPNGHARLFSTKWMSRKVPENHHKWSWGHDTGLSNGFWIYAVKAKLHTYNITPIKRADYKTPTELWSSIKVNISHLWVFGCQAWVYIFKKRRHKLDPKSQEMIFIGYELGSKGFHFRDAAHHCFEISHDVKFKETLLPVKEEKLTMSNQVPSSNPPISEYDNESDHLGLELVIPDQPSPRPPSPGQSAWRQTAQKAQTQTHPNPPIAPPVVPTGV